MAQKKQNRFIRRFNLLLVWLQKHKIRGLLLGLVLFIVLYLLVSEVVWQIQVHIERNRYNAASAKVKVLSNSLDTLFSSKTTYKKYCSHSNFGGIFEVDRINCDITLEKLFLNISQQNFSKFQEQAKKSISNNSIELTSSYTNDPASIASYKFITSNIKCNFYASYYDKNTNSPYIGHQFSTNNEIGVIGINCGGLVKQDYFPINKN